MMEKEVKRPKDVGKQYFLSGSDEDFLYTPHERSNPSFSFRLQLWLGSASDVLQCLFLPDTVVGITGNATNHLIVETGSSNGYVHDLYY